MFNMFKDINQDLVMHCMERIVVNDPHHREDHILDVTLNAVMLAKKYGLHNLIPFKLAALIHDMYSGTNREIHHTLACEWAKVNLANYGYEVYADLVAGMCYAHRDSGTGTYRNLHEEIFAAADRGPLTLRSSVSRSVNHLTLDNEEDLKREFERTVAMLRRKFGANGGYSCYNRVHDEMYGRQVAAFQKELEHITFEQFKWIVDHRLDHTARLMSLENQYEVFMGE